MLWHAFQALLDIWVVVVALIGIVTGIIIGAIPGLGPTMAIALLICSSAVFSVARFFEDVDMTIANMSGIHLIDHF